jgi:hypothetical protein
MRFSQLSAFSFRDSRRILTEGSGDSRLRKKGSLRPSAFSLLFYLFIPLFLPEVDSTRASAILSP